MSASDPFILLRVRLDFFFFFLVKIHIPLLFSPVSIPPFLPNYNLSLYE